MVIVRSMLPRKADGPLTVQVPSPGQDRPSWLGVGAIAVIGFVVGVAWPRLAGVRLGPSVPDSPAASASEGEPPAAGVASPPAVAPAVPVAMPLPVAPSSPAAPSAPGSSSLSPSGSPSAGFRVSVAHGAIFSCKTAGGESLKGNDCGAVAGLDGVVLPRLRKLADCPDAAGTTGKVRLVVRIDFPRNALAVELGHDHAASGAGPLLACAKSALASATLDGIAHDNPHYSVAYAVTFGAPAAADPAPAAAAAPVASSDATARVEWDVAIVRDAPKTGKVLARLPRGTPLRVGAVKDGWYPVKYGEGFASDGWVYRGAIGR
jgi:hypothetical protein